MPKDATKNIDRYKIKGGQLNEFDFQKNQEEFAEASKPEGNLIPGTPPEQREEARPFLGKLIKKAGKRVASTKRTATSALKATTKKSSKKVTAKKSAKTAKASKSAKASKTTKSMPRGATAKKLAARKAAKK